MVYPFYTLKLEILLKLQPKLKNDVDTFLVKLSRNSIFCLVAPKPSSRGMFGGDWKIVASTDKQANRAPTTAAG